MTPEMRLHSRLHHDKDTGCWLYTGYVTDAGYGIICIGKKRLRAHRFSYEIHKGPIPKGLTLDHLCRVRHCVNPDHLEPVTLAVNVLRGNGCSAMHARRVNCKCGLPLTPIPGKKSRRHCLPCKREYMRGYLTRYYKKHKKRLDEYCAMKRKEYRIKRREKLCQSS